VIFRHQRLGPVPAIQAVTGPVLLCSDSFHADGVDHLLRDPDPLVASLFQITMGILSVKKVNDDSLGFCRLNGG
jgi:hypothetical protein